MQLPAGWVVTPNVDRYGTGERPLADGEHLPEVEPWHRATKDALTVWFRTAVTIDGALFCTDLAVESSSPITTTALRAVPLTAIVEHLGTRTLTWEDLGPPASAKTGLRRWYDEQGAEVLMDEDLRGLWFHNTSQPRTKQSRPRRGGEGPTTSDLERFATAYKAAVRSAPRRAMAQTVDLLAAEGFHISVATGHRWREACRRTDPPLLEPSQPNRRRAR